MEEFIYCFLDPLRSQDVKQIQFGNSVLDEILDDAIDLEQKKVLNRKKANPAFITNSETLITQRVEERGGGGTFFNTKLKLQITRARRRGRLQNARPLAAKTGACLRSLSRSKPLYDNRQTNMSI